MTRRLVLLGFLMLALAHSADAASKCSSTKIKAAGKKASTKLGCLAKGLGKAITPDSTCLAKAEVKFSSAVAKAEAKIYTDAGCLSTDDAAAIEGQVDMLYDDIDALVADNSAGAPNPCDSGKVKAAGKKVAAKLTCHAKAVAKGMGTDSTCLAKAEVKFSIAAAKAETKVPPACTATGDAGSYESTVDGAVDDVVNQGTGVTTTTSPATSTTSTAPSTTTTTTPPTTTTTTASTTTTSTTLPPCAGLVALTGKSLWLRAGVGMTVDNTGLVSQWPDQSGLAHDASASGTDRPQYVLSDPDGCPAVQFDGSITRMDVVGKLVSSRNAFTVLIASYTDSSGPQTQEIISNWAAPWMGMFFGRRNGTLWAFTDDWTPATGSSILMDTTTVMTFRSSATDAEIFQNGTLQASKGSNLTGNPGGMEIDENGPWVLGTQGTYGSEYFQGYVRQIVVFDRVLDDTERAQAEQCLLGCS